MAAQEITSIVIEKGTDFSVSFLVDTFDGNPLDLSSYTPFAKIRKYPSASFYKSFDAEVLGITGHILLSMSAEDTSQLKTGRNYFDVLLVSEIETIKVVKGTIMVEDTATL